MSSKRVSEMTDEEIRQMASSARFCVCGDPIEEIDSGNGYTYWAHVKISRIEYDHSAVPSRI
jgi:hypothetical protein